MKLVLHQLNELEMRDFTTTRKKFYLLFLLFGLLNFNGLTISFGQGAACNQAEEFCAEDGLTFSASVNNGTASGNAPGNNYGCLFTSPNPAWYYLTTSAAGVGTVNLTNSSNVDVDYALWGPFFNLAAALGNCGFLQTPTSCSYSPSANESFTINSAGPGEVYILLITNFSNSPTQISGAGGDDILACTQLCDPEGGVLNQPNVNGCIGDSDLNLNITPNYPPPMVAPPADYPYTYLVTQGGGILFGLDAPGPDLSSLPPGSFTVCGLSYSPEAVVDVALLSGQNLSTVQTALESSNPPFCGDVSDDCFDVTVGLPVPPVTVNLSSTCGQESIILPNGEECFLTDGFGSCSYDEPTASGCPQTTTYIVTGVITPPVTVSLTSDCAEGDYLLPNGELCPLTNGFGSCSFDEINADGCPQLVTYIITGTIIPPQTVNLFSTCDEDFITLPNGEECALDEGFGSCTFEESLDDGCTQIVTYIITPGSGGGPSFGTLDTTACVNQCVNIEGIDVCAQDTVIIIDNFAGCDSFLNIHIDYIDVNAQIAPPDMLGCNDAMVTLDGSASSGNDFEWTDIDGNVLGNATTLDVSSIGCYLLSAYDDINNPSCVDTMSVCVLDDGIVAPTTPSPSGDTPICIMTSGTYTVPVNADVSYTWSVSANGSITSGQNTNEITVDWTSEGTAEVCVIAENICGPGDEECLPVTISGLPEEPTIIGDDPVCPEGTGTYSVSVDATITGFVWTVPADATITSGENTNEIEVTFGTTTGDICVTISDECGDAPQACFPVTFFDLPADADVTGTATFCPGQTFTYSTPTDVNTTDYNWTVPSCATINSGQNTNEISVTWNTDCTTGGDICVDVSNDCGTGQGDCFPVTIIPPANPPTIGGPTAVCQSSTEAYFVGTPVAGETYTWEVPTGATIVPGPTSDQITINWGTSAGGDVCVTATGTCGAIDPVCINVSTDGVPALGSVVGDTIVCNNTTAIYSIGDLSTANTYTWTADCGDITMGQNTTSITLDVTGICTTINLCVTADTECGETSPACLIININDVPPAPTDITGTTTPCLNSTETYCVNDIPDADAYTWSIIGSGNILSGQNTDCIEVEWIGTGAGEVCVTPVNTCGDGQQLCLDVNVNEVIAEPISSNCDNTNTNYTISFTATGGVSPYMITGIDGTWTGDDFVSNPLPSGSTYTFTITDSAGCISQEYTDSILCDCTTDAGTIVVESLSNCEDMTVIATHNEDEILDGNDIAQFIIHSGDPIGGQIFAANTTGEFGLTPPMTTGTTYYISLAVGNDNAGSVDLTEPCAQFTEGVPVVFYAYPNVNAGNDAAICGLTYELTATEDFGGIWSMTGGTGMATFADNTAPTTTVTVTEYGIYTFTWTENNNSCISSDEVEITFNNSPSIEGSIAETCNSTNTAYTIEFTVIAGNAPYVTDGVNGTWTGNVFTSEELTTGSNYTFNITDANGCVSQEYMGSHICDCDTEAGTMSATQLEACADGTVIAIHNGDQNLDGDDISEYLLHDGDPINGQIFDTNSTGVFGLVPPMQTEVVYFISLAVGDSDGNGNVNLDADCADFAIGQPVVFRAYPSPSAGANDGICGLTYALMATPDFTSGMWSQTSGPGTSAFTDPTGASTDVTVTEFGIYTFTWTENNNGCEGDASVEVTFNDAPNIAAPQVETCDLSTSQYTVEFDIEGGQAPYFVNGVMITGTNFVSMPIASNVVYSFSVTDANGCGPVIVEGVRNCDCQTDAGTMGQTLQETCIGGTVSGLPNGDEINDGDDAVQYILHDGTGTFAGTIFDLSNTPDFSLVAPMQTGVTYYISTIIGNDTGGGVVDQTESCFRVAVGTPVIFHPLPDGNISGDATICENGSADILFNLSGTAPFTIVFDGNTFTDQPAQFTQTLSPSTTTTYELTQVMDANACMQTVSSSVIITVNTPPSATVSSSATICNSTDSGNGTTLDFSTFVTGGDTSGTWTDTDNSGATGSFTNLDFDGLDEGVYTFTYTTGAAMPPCDDVSYTIEITVEDCMCPSLETIAPDDLCNSGGILNLTDLQITTEPGTWSIINQPAGANATLNGSNFSAQDLPAGDYTFEFTISEAPPTGCPTTSQETLTINQAVDAGFANAAIILCENEGSTINLFGELSNADTGGTWSEQQGSNSTGNAFNPNVGTFNPNGQSSGTYVFVYTVSGDTPCADASAEVTITVRPVPVADAGEDTEITCFTEFANIGGDAENTEWTYTWTTEDGGEIAPDDINLLNPTVFAGGTYILTVTDALTGCSDSDEVIVESLIDTPIPDITISDISCFGENDGTININSVMGGEPPYVYSIDGETFNTTSFFTDLSPGEYSITIQDANGCPNTVSFDIEEPDELNVEIFAFIDGDNVIRFGDSLQLSLNVEPTIDFDSLDNVAWFPSEILDCDTCEMVWATPLETTNFSVMIEDEGCTAEDNLLVVVRKDAPIFVPNAFSPNGDDFNDILYIYASDQVAKINAFLVYDRWGEAVHEYYDFFPNDPVFGWDGNQRGEPLNPQVFAWYAQIELTDGRVEIIEGDVTLIR